MYRPRQPRKSPFRSLSSTADDSVDNMTKAHPKKVTLVLSIIKVSSTTQSSTRAELTRTSSDRRTALSPKRMSDFSQESKAHSPEGVIGSPQGWRETDAQGDKTKLQAKIFQEPSIQKWLQKRKRFLKENLVIVPKCTQITLTKITVHPDKKQITKDINFGNRHNNFKLHPIMTVHNK